MHKLDEFRQNSKKKIFFEQQVDFQILVNFRVLDNKKRPKYTSFYQNKSPISYKTK